MVLAARHADRLLAVLVHDHVEAARERVAVVEVERPPIPALMVEQFVLVFGPLERVTRCPPDLAHFENGVVRLSAVGKEAAQFERQRPAGCFVELERIVGPEIEDNAIPLEQLGDGRDMVLERTALQLHICLKRAEGRKPARSIPASPRSPVGAA